MSNCLLNLDWLWSNHYHQFVAGIEVHVLTDKINDNAWVQINQEMQLYLVWIWSPRLMYLFWSSISHNPPCASEIVRRVDKDSCHPHHFVESGNIMWPVNIYQICVLQSSVIGKYFTWTIQRSKNWSQVQTLLFALDISLAVLFTRCYGKI